MATMQAGCVVHRPDESLNHAQGVEGGLFACGDANVTRMRRHHTDGWARVALRSGADEAWVRTNGEGRGVW
jgi:hypothetical protein